MSPAGNSNSPQEAKGDLCLLRAPLVYKGTVGDVQPKAKTTHLTHRCTLTYSFEFLEPHFKK
jgi:hypothetical protein